jgi:ribonuclease PH
MRIDGRADDEIRPVRITPGFVDYAEGSVLIEMGKTRVLCNASVEESVPPWRMSSKAGWVTAEYAMLPRSTHQRTRRETLRPSARSQEIRRLIGRSLRAALDLSRLGERTIILDCDVLRIRGPGPGSEAPRRGWNHPGRRPGSPGSSHQPGDRR